MMGFWYTDLCTVSFETSPALSSLLDNNKGETVVVRHLPPSFLNHIQCIGYQNHKSHCMYYVTFHLMLKCAMKRGERKTVGAGERARVSLYSRLEVFGLIYGGTGGGGRHWAWREYGQPSKVRSKRYREIGGHRFYILKLICSRKDLRWKPLSQTWKWFKCNSKDMTNK